MDMEEMGNALRLLEQAHNALLDAGEQGLSDSLLTVIEASIDRYAAEGGDRTMYDAILC